MVVFGLHGGSSSHGIVEFLIGVREGSASEEESVHDEEGVEGVLEELLAGLFFGPGGTHAG